MSRRSNTHVAWKEASAGAIPELETAGITVIVCVLLAAACFAAPLLLELPQVMEAAAVSRPGLRVNPRAASADRQALQPAQPALDSHDGDADAESPPSAQSLRHGP